MENSADELYSLHVSSLVLIKELNNKLEKLELGKYDLFMELINGIIDVIDTFEKAEEVIIEKQLNNTNESRLVINRYNSVYKRLQKLIEHYGVSKLTFPDNHLIVGFCKIVETEPDSSKPNDSIITVVRAGYVRGSELIREAEVIVVKN